MAVDTYKINLDIVGLNKLAKYQSELRKTNKELGKLEDKVSRQKGANAAQRVSIAKLSVEQAKLTNNITKQTNKLAGNTSAKKRNSAATKSNAAATKKSVTATKSSTASMLKMGAGAAMAIAALRKLGTFLMGSVKDFAAFELGVKNTTTLLSANDTSLFSESFYTGVISLSKEYGLTLDDVNKSMFNAVSAGIKGGDAVEFLAEAAELAIAGVTTLKSATTGLTTVLNAYGLEASEAARISGVLFTTQKYGVTTVDELSKSLGVVVPFAAASGISIEELGAAIAVTTRSGLDAAKSVTALRAAISQMQKPAAASRDLFVKYGIPIGAAQMKAVGFTETLKKLNHVYKTSPRDIELMFGNVRGLTAIFSLAGDNADSYNKILAETSDESITAANKQKALEENVDSTSKALDKLNTSFSAYKVNIGDSDFWRDTIESVTSYLDVLSNPNISGWDKTLGYMFALQELVTLGFVNEDADAFLKNTMDESQIAALTKEAKEFDEVLKKSNETLNKVTGIGESGVMNLGAAELQVIDVVLSKEHLASYSSDLAKRISVFKAFLEKRKIIQDSDTADEEAENDRKAGLAKEYELFEYNSRLNLARQIKTLNEIDETDGESRANTDVSILHAKIQRQRNLLVQFRKSEIKDEKQLLAIQSEIDKLVTQAKKKNLNIRLTNTDKYNLDSAALTKEYQEKKTDSALTQAKTRALTNKQFNIKNIEDEIAYQESLLLLTGSSEAEKAKITSKLSNLQVKLAKATFTESKKIDAEKVDLAKQGFDLILDAAKAAAEAELENEQKKLDKKKTLNDEALADGLINARVAKKRNDDIDKEAFKLRKNHEIKMAKISLIQELGNIAVMAAANPTNAITFGGAGISQYALLAGLALGRYALNVDTIKSQKFAKGGMVNGNSHAQGGEKFAVGGQVAELEGGEAVINKRSTAMFGGALSAMNVAGGGNSFSSPNLGGGGGLIDYNTLGRVIGRNTNVVLPVESLRKTQNRVRTIEANSKF